MIMLLLFKVVLLGIAGVTLFGLAGEFLVWLWEFWTGK